MSTFSPFINSVPPAPPDCDTYAQDVDALRNALSLRSDYHQSSTIFLVRRALEHQLDLYAGYSGGHLRSCMGSLIIPFCMSDTFSPQFGAYMSGIKLPDSSKLNKTAMATCIEDLVGECRSYSVLEGVLAGSDVAIAASQLRRHRVSKPHCKAWFIQPDLGMLQHCLCRGNLSCSHHQDCLLTMYIRAFEDKELIDRVTVAIALWHAWRDWQKVDLRLGPVPCSLEAAIEVRIGERRALTAGCKDRPQDAQGASEPAPAGSIRQPLAALHNQYRDRRRTERVL